METWPIIVNNPTNQSRVGFYEIDATIGRGNYAVVKRAHHRIVRNKVAIKVIDKGGLDKSTLTKLQREVAILKTLSHPYIIHLYQVLETRQFIYLVTEYAPNGEIYDQICQQVRFTEDEARWKFWQMISAVEYIHKNGFVHRDLKSENLLLDENNRIKIADFGFSNYFKKGDLMETFCGSPPYAAPEVFEGKAYQGPLIDVWSLGVVLYVMVCGSMPFEAATIQGLRDRVLTGRYRVPFYMSTDCEHLLKRMLTVDPTKRASIESIKKHRWMQIGNLQEKIELEVMAHNYLCTGDAELASLRLMTAIGVKEESIQKALRATTYNHAKAIFALLMERYRKRYFKAMVSSLETMQEQQRLQQIELDEKAKQNSDTSLEGPAGPAQDQQPSTSHVLLPLPQISLPEDAVLRAEVEEGVLRLTDDPQSALASNEVDLDALVSNSAKLMLRESLLTPTPSPHINVIYSRPRPFLSSLRGHKQFQTTDTAGSNSQMSDSSRMSTTDTNSVDEGVETDMPEPQNSPSTPLLGQIAEETRPERPFESFESQLEPDMMSSVNSCPSNAQSTETHDKAEARNSSADALPEEAPTADGQSLFGEGFRASDNAMFKNVPFPTGKLNPHSANKDVAGPSHETHEGTAKSKLFRSPPGSRLHQLVASFSKRVSLPDDLEYQPQKYLNYKQSVEVEQRLEGRETAENRFIRARFLHYQKRKMNKARIQLQKYTTDQNANQPIGLPPRPEETKLASILDSPREDNMDMA